MSINETPSGERLHIGIFGRRNAGKSSLINAITGQDLAIVSDVKGTTTDPVKKAMELLPLGPVVLIDTPGLDDEGLLGQKRMEKALQALRQTDIVILTIPVDAALDGLEKTLLQEAKKRGLPFFVVLNKTDLLADKKQIEEKEKEIAQALSIPLDVIVAVGADKNEGIYALKEKLANGIPKEQERPLIHDLLSPGDLVVLVVPIDSAAPKGRLILPQQQVIRDSLEAGAVPVVTRDSELAQALSSLGKKPRLIVTDSQVFGAVAKIVPKDIPLTSFSILMARYKGDLEVQIAGAKAIETLQDGDMVLISEGCTHHRQCDDIGTVKMPRWIKEYTGKDLQFAFTSGGEFPKDLSPYAMVVHCGERSFGNSKQEVAITNYGVMIAYIHGILPRVTEIFVDKK